MSQARTHDTLVLFEPYNMPLMGFGMKNANIFALGSKRLMVVKL